MSQTIYATFIDAEHAEKAIGALLDHGVLKESISVVAKDTNTLEESAKTDGAEDQAKTGITTTTGADAGAGAAKGAGIGLGLGVLAGLAALMVPGFGLVVGGGALAAAIGAAAATTAAGAVAGGVTGYLKDQGLPEEAVRTYIDRLETGGTLVAVMLPSGGVDVPTGQELISKYSGADVNVY
jgi:hypothetical protein